MDGGDDVLLNDDKDQPEIEIVAESSKSEVKSAEDGVAELKKRLADSEEAQKRLERERNEAVSRAYQAKNETEDTNLRLIESAKAQVLEGNKFLKREYATALQAQDYERAADIQEAMALNQAKALQLENGAQSLKDRPKEAPAPLDPVEAFISNAKLGPRPAAWIRAHPEYATNERLTQKMIAADNVADGDGFQRGTDAYFERVEEILKVSQRAPTRAVQDEDEDERFSDASRSTSGRQTAPAAIPVSRDVSPSGQRQRLIKLTPDQADAAERSQMTHREWWDEHQKILAERRGYAN